jgi:hypothetical protein
MGQPPREARAAALLILLVCGALREGCGQDWLIDPSSFQAKVELGATEIAMGNGLLRRTFRIDPNAATIALDLLVTDQALLRGVKPEALLQIDAVEYQVGGLLGQPNYAYLTREWVEQLSADPAALQYVGHEAQPIQERFAWKRVRRHAADAPWPPAGVHLRMDYAFPAGGERRYLQQVRVSVHYEMYDGIPAYCKWLSVHNGSDRTVNLDRFACEVLAAVEHSSQVEVRSGVPLPAPDLHVETDYAFGSFTPRTANRFAVHWETDPDYHTQVNYLRQTPCLLKVRPSQGPDQTLAPGSTWESFRAFVLAYDSSDRERRGLALRQLYRTLAPWVTENPLMMHVRYADRETVLRAIDQCAAVGFEMVILTFGSGFNIEDESPEYLQLMREYVAAAQSQGIEIGGYSLLSSRRIGDGQDVVSPPGERPTHGNCPALTSSWGQEYFGKLYRFFEKTGFRLLEHDGSYPGDLDVSARPPLQKGLLDSRWAQWRVITDFYKYCRGEGVYLNVPDYYYLSGSNKCGMGYREVNWSLPRDQQVLHTRQNIYDGTWQKTPSMGWMFVPLTEYQGGGAAATIEPLEEHLEHYERMLTSNLGLGVQACYRGPRLFDSDRTRQKVKEWVDWFKVYRDILESDLIHGRRADGRDLDWMLHVNPRLGDRGMLVVYNPLKTTRRKLLRVPLYYTGLGEQARIQERGGAGVVHDLDRGYFVDLEVEVPPRGMNWYVITEAP